MRIELFVIYRFRFAFIAPGISPLDSFRLQKLSLQKFGMNIHDISIRAIIEELSTHFTENKLIIYLVYRLLILLVMRECSTRKHVPFGLVSEPIKCLHRHPLGFVIDRLNTSASLLQVRFVFKSLLKYEAVFISKILFTVHIQLCLFVIQ